MAIKHTFIFKQGQKTKNLTALSAVREKCLECCGWSTKDVAECLAADCALYPFRFGRYPQKYAAGGIFFKKYCKGIPN